MTRKRVKQATILSGCLLLTASLLHGATVERQIEQPFLQSIQIHQSIQKQEEQWRLDKERLTARLQQLQEENQDLQTRGKELRQTLASSQTSLAAKKQQWTDSTRITGEIDSFFAHLFQQLKQLTADSPPFFHKARQQHLEQLQVLLIDPAVSSDEKYRQLMEALLQEARYGLTAEVYQDHISLNSQNTPVEIFRLGRLRLFYLTLDQKNCGFFNAAAQAWQSLPDSHLRSVRAAVAIGAVRQPAELVSLPVDRLVRR